MLDNNSEVLVDDFDFEELDPNSPIFPPSPRQNDFLRAQARWEEEDRARQMVRYHDRNYYGADQQRSSNHLAVPTYEKSPRRPRARSDTRADARNYKTQEVRPTPSPLKDGKRASDDPPRRAGAISPQAPSSPKSSRPPPKIIQPDPPKKSPGKSSRGPNDEPIRLRLKYFELQNQLADVRTACRRFLHVEPSDPQQLSFAKISDQVKSFEFDLEVWYSLANVENVPRTDLDADTLQTVTAAARSLDRLTDQAIELKEACTNAKPNDLRFTGLPQLDDEEDLYIAGDDEAAADKDPMESLGFVIHASLHSIELQVQNLKRLVRSLQETTPEAREEVGAVADVVHDTVHFFGSEEALKRYAVDEKYAGRRALVEARSAARLSR